MDGGRLHGEERLRQQLVDRATAAHAVPHWLHDGAQDHGCPAPRLRVPFSADGYIRRLEMDWRRAVGAAFYIRVSVDPAGGNS